MALSPEHYSQSQEALLVSLARTGDRDAFQELVRRRQSWIRNLMRRCSRDISMADDLAQQVFLQAWRTIRRLQQPDRFAAWLKRIAINVWLQQKRRNDPLRQAIQHDEPLPAQRETPAVEMDLDCALATLPDPVRLCIVLSYHERMTHPEIAELTKLPPGTIKSHIRRGTHRLQELLSAYTEKPPVEKTS